MRRLKSSWANYFVQGEKTLQKSMAWGNDAVQWASQFQEPFPDVEEGKKGVNRIEALPDGPGAVHPPITYLSLLSAISFASAASISDSDGTRKQQRLLSELLAARINPSGENAK